MRATRHLLLTVCSAALMSSACGGDSASDDATSAATLTLDSSTSLSTSLSTEGSTDADSETDDATGSTQSSTQTDTSLDETGDATTDATETGGADAMFVPPIERDVMVDGQMQPGYVLEFTNDTDTVTFECIAEKGGLITAWKLNGVNILLEDPNASTLDGSTFWPSPQSDWNWPPPSAIDSASYTVTVDESNMSVLLVGQSDGTLNVRVEKRFTVDLEREAITLEYSLINTGTNDRSFAPWEISRVPAGGLTLYPTGSNSPSSGTFQPIPVTEAAGVTWFEHTPTNVMGQHKLFADGDRGWLAHTKDELVFVKTFENQDASAAAPNEAEIELYATPDYEEVEQQGAYTSISPSQPLVWMVTWFLRPMPGDATATPGDMALVDFIDALPQ